MVRRKVSWKKGYIPKPWPSNPMKKLYADYFNFHFTNELTPPGRNGCYICYEVQETHSLLSLDRGVFENQFYPKKRVHAEVCFLNWFKEWPLLKTLNPGELYRITWYMSWSPCVECAQQVADFLNTQKCVRLRITFSRLYHSNKPEYQQGLRNLAGAGAELAVMSPEEFEYCWDNFVDHRGRSFRYWNGIRRNYHALKKTLEEILCSPMHSLPPKTYSTNFPNLLFAPGLNNTYICYEVAKRKNNSLKPCYWGVFRNQFYPKKRVHAEVCFLNWFKEWPLLKTRNPGELYRITWYMSWSPCVECAQQVADFLNTQKCVRLRITFSRLYHSNKLEYQQGLRNLAGAGAELAVMSPKDFKRCWKTFVDLQEPDFQPWSDLDENSEKLSKMLEGILRIQGN